MKRLLLALPLLAALSACEQLGIDDPAKLAAAKEAEGKAVGSACRHAMRAIEDCYVLNPKAQKAAVYAGWREMDEYMRENKLDGIAPTLPSPGSRSAPAASPPQEEAEASADSGKPTKTAKAKGDGHAK